MPHLDINFDKVPDQMEPIAPGVYVFSITEASIEENAKKTGNNLVVTHKIDEPDSPMNGRTFKNYFSLEHEIGKIGLKQLLKSCGIPLTGGLDVEALLGKVGRARMKADTYRDKETGQVKETSRVAEYVFA